MAGDVFTFIVGGKAGEGVKKAGNAAANMLAARGLNVFQ
jgi:Pyruvate/2-oxoacid:ferredoxin oxidoreductase gamma subunit